MTATSHHSQGSRRALPSELQRFAAAATGDFEHRFARIVEHAFNEHALMLNAAQLRKLCAGGSQATAERAISNFRQRLHDYSVQRLSASAIAEWIEEGMSPEMPGLSSKERHVARAFLRHVAAAKAVQP